MQVNKKITGLKSTMTDEFTNFKSTVTGDIDTKSNLVDVQFNNVSTTLSQNLPNKLDIRFKCELGKMF